MFLLERNVFACSVDTYLATQSANIFYKKLHVTVNLTSCLVIIVATVPGPHSVHREPNQ